MSETHVVEWREPYRDSLVGRLLPDGHVRVGAICTTGRHEHHGHAPWQSGSVYSVACEAPGCDLPASPFGGSDNRKSYGLCDCHFEDWSAFVEANGSLKSIGRPWQLMHARFLASLQSEARVAA